MKKRYQTHDILLFVYKSRDFIASDPRENAQRNFF